MTQEQKELLLKDLCSRLPYEVKVLYDNKVKKLQYIEAVYNEVKLLDYITNYTVDVSEVKPYLFPMSSMTEEQRKEYLKLCKICIHNDYTEYFSSLESIEWLYENHFDVHGLIPKGLAIDATHLNIY